MALRADSYGFIIGEKRYKELNGNLSNIDGTTKEILAVLLAQNLHSINNRLQSLQSEQQAQSRLITRANKALYRAVSHTPVTKTIQNNEQVKPSRPKRAYKVQKQDSKQNRSQINDNATNDNATNEQGNTKQSVLPQALSLSEKIIDAIDTPSSENLSPEIDAIQEVGDVVKPAGKAFVAIGKGASHLYGKKTKRNTFIPKEQTKQHKLDKKHDIEEIRLYRLILMKLKDKGLLGLLGGLGNLLRGLGGLGGVDIDRKKKKGGKPTVVAGKDGKKNDTKTDNKTENKTDKKPDSKSKTYKGKTGLVASLLAAVGIGALFDDESSDKPTQQPTKQPTKQPKNTTQQPVKQTSTLAKVGVGAMAGGATAMAINPLLAPVGMVLGGLGGIVADKLMPYFGRATNTINANQQLETQNIGSELQLKQANHQLVHDTALANTAELKTQSETDLTDKENELNTGYSNRNILAEQHAKQTDGFLQGLFKTALSWFDGGIEWVASTLTGLWDGVKSFIDNIKVAVTGGASGGDGVTGKVLVGVMGKYNITYRNGKRVNLSDTGAGSGDHFDISIADGGAGKGTDPYSILHLLQTDSGKNLKDMVDSKEYTFADTQKYGASRDGGKRKHIGVDIDPRAFGGRQGGQLFIADGVKVLDMQQKNNPGGYGFYIDATVIDPKTNKPVTIRLAHQNKTGTDEVMAQWQAHKQKQTATATTTNTVSTPTGGGNYAAIDYNRGISQATAKAIQRRTKKDQYGYYQLSAGVAKHYRYAEASQSDLVDVKNRRTAGGRAFVSGGSGNSKIHKEMVAPLEAMIDAAAKDGVNLAFASGFRTIKWAEKNGDGSKSSAPAGGSEHHTGFAIDFTNLLNKQESQLNAEERKTLKWLDNYAAQFGFVRSFTKNNKLGVADEIWHWKYVGSDYAVRALTPQGGSGAILPDGRVITSGTLKNAAPPKAQQPPSKNQIKARANILPTQTGNYTLPNDNVGRIVANVREPIYPSKPSKAVQGLIEPTPGGERLPVHILPNNTTWA